MDDYESLFDKIALPDNSLVFDDLFDRAPEFYARVILAITDHAPLLSLPALAQIVMVTLQNSVLDAPGTLWGYVVLPGSVQFIVGPTDENGLEAFITQVKARTAHHLLAAIRRAEDDSLDMVLRYSPVWGGAIYQVWQAGSHRTIFWTEYRLSNALYDLQRAPVEAGLVESAEAWPYSQIGGESLE